jgi:signal transduction histidine kinase/ligand-binding sensor domain-containing protein/AraC-like DNA-binding protein
MCPGDGSMLNLASPAGVVNVEVDPRRRMAQTVNSWPHRLRRPLLAALTLATLWGAARTVMAAPALHQTRWEMKDGLPLRTPEHLAITPDGFLWIASYEGLARFDGRSFVSFQQGSGGLPSNRIERLQVDHEGRLWLHIYGDQLAEVTPDGFALLHYDGEPLYGLRALFLCGGQALAWSGPALYRRVAQGEAVLAATLPEANWTDARCYQDGSMIFVQDHRAWLLPKDAPGRWLEAPDDSRLLSPIDAPNGERWLSAAAGLYALRDGALAPIHATDGPFLGLSAGLLGGDGALTARANDAWWRLDAHGATRAPITNPNLKRGAAPMTLANGEVWYAEGSQLWRQGQRALDLQQEISALLAAPNGDLWLIANNEALIRLRAPTIHTLNAAQGLPTGRLFSLLTDRDGALWAGVWGHGVARWERPLSGLSRPHLFPTHAPDELHYADTSALFQDHLGQIWSGYWGGLQHLHEGSFSKFHLTDSEREHDAIRALLRDRRGDTWLGRNSGLYVGDLAAPDRPWRALGPESGLPQQEIIYALHEAADGTLLVGARRHGVYRKDPALPLFWPLGQGTPLERANARALTAASDAGTVWVGTESSGLCRLRQDGAQWRVACLDPRRGLPDQGVHCALDDAQGRVWISTNSGLAWIDADQLHAALDGQQRRVYPVTFNERDGMADAECNGGFQHPCARGLDGALYFPTQDGVAAVDPARVPRPSPATPLLTRHKINDMDPVTAPLRLERALQLSHDQRRLEVWWGAPDLLHGPHTHYQLRLASSDDEPWFEPSEPDHATWTWLPPGASRVEIRAGIGGRWGPPTTLLRLHRARAFQETNTYKLLILLAILFVIAAAVWLYTWRLRRKRRELEQLVHDRTAELERRAVELVALNADLGQERAQLAQANARLAGQRDILGEQARQLTQQASRMEELSEAKNRFIANVSHELRTPLTLVLGLLQRLREEPRALSTRGRRDVEVAQRNAERLAELVEQLLEIARLEAGATPFRARLADLGAALRRVAGRFDHLGEARGLRWALRLPDAPVMAWFDPELIDTAASNLLSNAFKLTPQGGEVTLGLSPDAQGRHRVWVQDSGPGVPPEHQPHLFERFFQVKSKDLLTNPGTGLGLAITREIVELHGGEVGVRSAAGAGATFWFTLPAGSAHLAPEDIDLQPVALAAPPRAAGEGCQGQVLIVEDHPDMRAFLVEHLSERFPVTAACDGQEALERVAQGHPALIISDIMMPRVDGLELARRLRADPATAQIPLLLLSAKGGERARVEGLDLADDFLGKPFLMSELLARAARLLGRPLPPRADAAAAAADEPLVDDVEAPLGLADQAWIDRFERALDEHLDREALDMDQLAEALAMSRRALYRATERLLGDSPAALLRERRLTRACALLQEGATSTVAEVAARVGMTPTYFARAYKARFGRSPGQDLRR